MLDSVRNHQLDEARAEQLAEARAAQANQSASAPKAETAPSSQASLLNRAVEAAQTASEAGGAARQLSDEWSIMLQGENETSPSPDPAPATAPAATSTEAAKDAPPRPENYGLNDRDKELLAQPGIEAIRSRFHDALDKFSAGLNAYQSPNNSESGTIYDPEGYEHFRSNFVDPETAQIKYWDGAGFAQDWVDPESGLSGKDLFHLDESILEKQRGDEAAKKLTTVNLGSFTNNEVVKSVGADEVFSVIGRDQRGELLAEGHTTLGKAFVLDDGRMILPDEHETGVYFISSVPVNKLTGGGVIDTDNGGYNIDGLYLDGGNAHIGTARPKGGLFGGILNQLDKLLPGGKLGEITADAISDVNQFLNLPAKELLNAVGKEDSFLGDVIGHQEATVDVIAHADETGGRTYEELVERTAEFDKVDRVANQVGQALVATGIPIVSWIGAAVTVVSGSMMAGHAQLQGQDADPNQGIMQAAQAFLVSQAGSAIGSSAGTSASSWATDLGGIAAEYSTEVGTFARSFSTNLTSQAVNGGEIDLEAAFKAGVLGVAGGTTQIGDTGVSAVQVVQLGDAVRQADESGDWSQVGSMLTGFITDAAARNRSTETAGPVTEAEAEIVPGGGGDSPTQLSPEEVDEILFSGGTQREPGLEVFGPELDDALVGSPEVEGILAGTTLADARQLVRRIDNETGDQMVQTPDGSWVTRNPQSGMVRLEQVDPSGRSVVTSFGENGSVSGQRVTQTNGVVLEMSATSQILKIETNTQDRQGFNQAFAAAQAQGAGAFSWNGKSYHTGTRDQVNSLVSNFVSAHSVDLAGLSPEARQAFDRQAALAADQAFSRHALQIEAGQSDNRAGFDGNSLDSDFARAFQSAREVQQALDAQGTASTPATSGAVGLGLDWDAILAGGVQFSGGEFSALNQNPPATPDVADGRVFSRMSPEVESIVRSRNQELGPLPAASTVTSWNGAADQIERLRSRYQSLSEQEFDMVLRSAFYSNESGNRNQFPIWDPLLGSRNTNPEFVAAISDVQKHLPQAFPGPDGRPLDMSHAWVGVDALNNGPVTGYITALLLTHGGDLGQVLGQKVLNFVRSEGERVDPWAWAPASQMDANSMGFRLSQARNQSTSMAEAMRLLAQGAPGGTVPNFTPEDRP